MRALIAVFLVLVLAVVLGGAVGSATSATIGKLAATLTTPLGSATK